MADAPKFIRPRTEYAKQLYLYGNGDGKPITSAAKLSELTGVGINSLSKHRKEWDREREALLAQNSKTGISLRVKPEDIRKNEEDTAFLRGQMDELLLEMDGLDRVEATFQRLLDNFDCDMESADKALAVFDSYLKAHASRKSVRSQFLEVQKRWQECAGITAVFKVAETRENEMAKGMAKVEVRRAIRELEETDPDNMRQAKPGLSVFRRSGDGNG